MSPRDVLGSLLFFSPLMHNRSPLFRVLPTCRIWALAFGLIGAFVPLPAALAQATKIFVASTGNDANDGSRGSPKRNFQAAHNAVASSGQIVALDTAGYGALSITKSVSVTVPPGVNGFVTVTGSSNGIAINATGSDTVSLRGLIVEGPSTGFGIFATQVGTLRVEDCTVRNFNNGIFVNSSTDTHLLVSGGSVRDVAFNGIIIEPSVASAAVEGIVTGCAVDKAAGVGIYAFNQIAGGSANLTARDCVVTGSNFGVAAFGAGSTITADNCAVNGNTNRGVTVFSGGTSVSRGNNTFNNNAADGTFTGAALAPK